MLEKAASSVGLTRRHRKVRAQTWFWTLVHGFGAGRERTILGPAPGHRPRDLADLVASALAERVTKQIRWLKEIVGDTLIQISEPTQGLRGLLKGCRDLVLELLDPMQFRGASPPYSVRHRSDGCSLTQYLRQSSVRGTSVSICLSA